MNSVYNQKPLDEQSVRLTQFVIGNSKTNQWTILWNIDSTSRFYEQNSSTTHSQQKRFDETEQISNIIPDTD